MQGRKSRYRTPDDVEAIVRANAAQGITRFFVTDDNFARNRNWEPILDRLIELRENEDFNIRLLLQVDTLCHRIPGFIEKAARAGCTAVFIGLENINPAIADGGQEAPEQDLGISRHAAGVAAGKVMTYAGYILGFPTDTPETIARDIEIIKRELPVDILEFFFLTPLPGSEDHKICISRGGDGPRHEQIRPRTCLHRASVDVGGDLGKGLCRRLDALLHRCACRDDHAPRDLLGLNRTKVLDSHDHLLRRSAHRGRASAAIRFPAPQDQRRSGATACRCSIRSCSIRGGCSTS